jgi:hypothetical protein
VLHEMLSVEQSSSRTLWDRGEFDLHQTVNLETLLRGQTCYLMRAAEQSGLSGLVDGLLVLSVRAGHAFRSALLIVHLSALSRRVTPVVIFCAACNGRCDLVFTG